MEDNGIWTSIAHGTASGRYGIPTFEVSKCIWHHEKQVPSVFEDLIHECAYMGVGDKHLVADMVIANVSVVNLALRRSSHTWTRGVDVLSTPSEDQRHIRTRRQRQFLHTLCSSIQSGKSAMLWRHTSNRNAYQTSKFHFGALPATRSYSGPLTCHYPPFSSLPRRSTVTLFLYRIVLQRWNRNNV